MTELKKHALPLTIIVLLLIAKMIIVPIFDWQNALVAEITLLEKRQNKITHVLGKHSHNEQENNELTIELDKLTTIFFPLQTEADFKLTQQKMLESIMAKHTLKSQNIGWQTAKILPEISAIRYPIKMSIEGKHINLINFISDIETSTQHLEIIDFNVSFKGQREKGLGRVTGSLTLYLYANLDAKTMERATG